MASAISWRVRNLAAVTGALVLVVTAAVGVAWPERSAPSAPTGGAPTVAPVPGHAVVGTWTRSGTCRDVVAALHRYGLDEFAPAAVFASRFHPGAGEPVLDDSCEGTIGRQLANEFTPDGRFSAFNGLGEQVDTTVYRPTGEHHLVLDRYGGVQVGLSEFRRDPCLQRHHPHSVPPDRAEIWMGLSMLFRRSSPASRGSAVELNL